MKELSPDEIRSFQQERGLHVTGELNEQTQRALEESRWKLGDRSLNLQPSPMMRGDDVAALQARLTEMGFNAGRVDGIFGPKVVSAITDFQLNIGVEGNGICTPELVDALRRMGLQSGTGPGVAVVREAAELNDAMTRDDARVVVGHFAGTAPLAVALTRRAREAHPLTTTVDGDASSQAQAANRFQADVYVGFEVASDAGCTIYFYEVPTFFSAGGRNLALRIAAAIAARAPELHVQTLGVRHPVLRETRMTAVLCSMGPHEVVSLKTNAVSTAICDALDAWRENPATEI